MAECTRTSVSAVILQTWPEVHLNHLTFAEGQIWLIFLVAGKVVILRKYYLTETETLGGIVLTWTRFCQEEFHISRFKCLAKLERSHQSSQEPGSQVIQLGLGTGGRSPMRKSSFWIKQSRSWKTKGWCSRGVTLMRVMFCSCIWRRMGSREDHYLIVVLVQSGCRMGMIS